MRQPVGRSPADVLRLVVAAVVVLILLLVEWLFGDTLVAFASDLLRGLDAVPQWILDVIVIGTRVLALVVLGGGLAGRCTGADGGCWSLSPRPGCSPSRVRRPRRPRRDRSRARSGRGRRGLGLLTTEGFVSTASVAAVAGILTAAAPWLADDGGRQAGSSSSASCSRTFLQAPVSFDRCWRWPSDGSAGPRSWSSAGAPSRRPTVGRGHRRARAVGLPVQRLDRAGVDARGSTPYFGVAADGTRLFVKALGTDERSADLLFRLYRGLQPHNLGDERAVQLAAAQRRARGVRRAERVGAGRAHAGAARVRDGRAERLRARLRSDRGQVARSPRSERGVRRRAGGDLGSRRPAAPAPDRPSRPPPGEHLPRRRRATPGSSISASARSPPPICCSPPTSPNCWRHRARTSGRSERSPTPLAAVDSATLVQAAGPAPPVGTERRDADGAQGPPGSPGGAPQPAGGRHRSRRRQSMTGGRSPPAAANSRRVGWSEAALTCHDVLDDREGMGRWTIEAG